MRVGQLSQCLTTLLQRLFPQVTPFVLHQIERDHDGMGSARPAPERGKVTVAVWPQNYGLSVDHGPLDRQGGDGHGNP
jgi:hypothetical protein